VEHILEHQSREFDALVERSHLLGINVHLDILEAGTQYAGLVLELVCSVLDVSLWVLQVLDAFH
jgi:hypothetical protein